MINNTDLIKAVAFVYQKYQNFIRCCQNAKVLPKTSSKICGAKSIMRLNRLINLINKRINYGRDVRRITNLLKSEIQNILNNYSGIITAADRHNEVFINHNYSQPNFNYCDIQGGVDSIVVIGPLSNIVWGDGNDGPSVAQHVLKVFFSRSI